MNLDAILEVIFMAVTGFSCEKETLKASTEPRFPPAPTVDTWIEARSLRIKASSAFGLG